MKKLLLASLLLLATAANAGPLDLALGGSRLAKAHKNWFKRLVLKENGARLYLEPIAGEEGSFHGVLLDYTPPLKVGPKYVFAHVADGKPNKIFGYLNHIISRIAVYKVTPSTVAGAYRMQPVKVVGSEIAVNNLGNPMTLILSDQLRIDDPLGGAKIFQADESGEQKTKYEFPTGSGGFLSQYGWLHRIYALAHLGSSWHKEYMTGPYLAAYEKHDDVVLNLSGQGEDMTASFVSDPKFDGVGKKEREKIFTNAKSAAIRGEFKATQSAGGMYVLTPRGDATEAGRDATGRIGLFIDIFDAREALGQAVVELVFVNPEDPKDFLMYYTGSDDDFHKTVEEPKSETRP